MIASVVSKHSLRRVEPSNKQRGISVGKDRGFGAKFGTADDMPSAFVIFISLRSITIYLHGFRYISRDCLRRHWTKLLGLGLQTPHVSCVQIRKAPTNLTLFTLNLALNVQHSAIILLERERFQLVITIQYRMHQRVSARMAK